MGECDGYKGRLYELCTGAGRDGRPNPTQSACNRFRMSKGLGLIQVDSTQSSTIQASSCVKTIRPAKKDKIVVIQSTVGTHLAQIFSDKIGAVPCSACKQTILDLNSLSVAEAIAKRAEMVDLISSRAARSASKWWQKAGVVASKLLGLGVTEYMIGMYYDQACVMSASDSRIAVPNTPAIQLKQKPRERSFILPAEKWCVVVTTAPRDGEYTLDQCVDSIHAAGWDDPVIFAEPGSKFPSDIRLIQNEQRRGCFHNWLYSARWALENSDADIILCVQDDSLFHPDSREFFEKHCIWPSNDTAFVSFYTPSHYSVFKNKTPRKVGINFVKTSCLWGTLAVAWKREVLQAVVDHDLTKNWLGLTLRKSDEDKASKAYRSRRVNEHYQRRKENPHTINNSDYLAGAVVNAIQKKMFFIDPSPVQHVSKVSSIGHGGNRGKRNCGRCADHSIPLYNQVLVDEKQIHMVKTKPIVRKKSSRKRRQIPPPKRAELVVSAGASIGDNPPHTIMIRSTFNNKDYSEYRWRVTQGTLLPALRSQVNKNFRVVLICGDTDALQKKKLDELNAIVPTTLATDDWYNLPHDGIWRRVSRLDDDDIVSSLFIELISKVPFDGTECLLTFPSGSLFTNERFYRWEYKENQFFTIQTNTRLNPYHFPHQYYIALLPVVHVSDDIHWCWIRHKGALSGIKPGGIPASFRSEEVALSQDIFNTESLSRSVAFDKNAMVHVMSIRGRNGKKDDDVKDLCASGCYGALTNLAEKYNVDKGVYCSKVGHQYTVVYDRLWGENREAIVSVMELGIHRGDSLRMWSDYFPNAKIHGVDVLPSDLDYPRVTTYKRDATHTFDKLLTFDIIIDDASHVSSQIRKAFHVNSVFVKPGGYYVVEDLMLCRIGKPFADESPTMLETCRDWVANPPSGWKCSLYGDQLCVLKKEE